MLSDGMRSVRLLLRRPNQRFLVLWLIGALLALPIVYPRLASAASSNLLAISVADEAFLYTTMLTPSSQSLPALCIREEPDTPTLLGANIHRLCGTWWLFGDSPRKALVWLEDSDPELRAGYSNMLTNLGGRYAQTGELSRADDLYQVALELFPNNYRTMLSIFELKASQGDWPSALTILTSTPPPEAPETSFEWWYRIGRAATELGQYVQAVQAYDRAAEAIQALVHERGLEGQLPAHIQAWVNQKSASVAAGRATIAKRQGEVDMAIAYWKQAVEILPRPWYYEQLVYMYREKGNTALALAAARQMADTATGDLWQYECLAARIFDEAGHSQEASDLRMQVEVQSEGTRSCP